MSGIISGLSMLNAEKWYTEHGRDVIIVCEIEQWTPKSRALLFAMSNREYTCTVDTMRNVHLLKQN